MTTTTRELATLDFAITPAMALERWQAFHAFVREQMVEGTDYGVIPGTDKPTLLKPGAEKLNNLYGLAAEQTVTERVQDWEHGFFFYEVKTALRHISSGAVISEGMGSCNSKESRYRWRWVAEDRLPPGTDKAALASRDTRLVEFAFAVEQGETTGQYGKPAAYWQQFREAIADGSAKSVKRTTRAGREFDAWEIGGRVYQVENPDVYDQVNTILKMAAKRSLVDAVLKATRASGIFTQDLEDLVEAIATIERGDGDESRPQRQAEPPRQQPQPSPQVAGEQNAAWIMEQITGWWGGDTPAKLTEAYRLVGLAEPTGGMRALPRADASKLWKALEGMRSKEQAEAGASPQEQLFPPETAVVS